jgi:hypothetical protein
MQDKQANDAIQGKAARPYPSSQVGNETLIAGGEPRRYPEKWRFLGSDAGFMIYPVGRCAST